MARLNVFGPPQEWPDQDLIAFSDTIDPALVLDAYRSGVFPMPLADAGFEHTGWWSPTQRGVLPLDSLRVTKSLRQAAKHYTTTIDAAFTQVLTACADPGRPYGWIDDGILGIYTELFRAGHCHSVETWDDQGRLVGGLYGISLGGLFAGESMFHDKQHGRDASKVALLRLVELLSDDHAESRIIDTQWQTPHLASLGVIEIDRSEYLELLDDALAVPEAPWPRRDDHA
ncbi:MAG: leucyl/phenylalanyl-tRNA--protein transferase [Actinobacteria bacterium]|nr:leucyl/phenylalanyl-tRNA--protein transferase [Actinomycetota bacterium]MBU4363896.1 leucyl/phenylalanyl-tRNA--protein transferase [Actinomycetota bacterium]MBU4415669.1 leucyl/phenylalanyl-tRNA--protein transferase [Actinomycetota bacterium]MBU4587191.1 leucyl/phenylalanyl-tRNA--protein transferase [Actinomycetota bacterium]